MLRIPCTALKPIHFRYFTMLLSVILLLAACCTVRAQELEETTESETLLSRDDVAIAMAGKEILVKNFAEGKYS